MQYFRKAIIAPTLFVFSIMTIWLPAANAAILSTSTAQEASITPNDGDAIQDFLSREAVRDKLVELGVDPQQASKRVESLTAAERQLLEQKIAELPAGAGVIEVLGIVFLVLLILELLGVTDIFKRI